MCVSTSYMCPLPETVVTCDSHDTDVVWLISPWYKHDTGYVTHMIQMLWLTPSTWYKHETATCDTHDTGAVWSLLPHTIMIQSMWHTWYRHCVTPFFLIQTWHCHIWHTWYRCCLTPSTWYKHDTATTDTHATDLDPSLQGGKSGVHGVGFPPI